MPFHETRFHQVIKKANDTLNGISSSSVCTEVIQSAQGMEYLLGMFSFTASLTQNVLFCIQVAVSGTCACSELVCISPLRFIPTGVVEVYRVTKRVELGIKATAVCSEKLQQLLKDIDKVWNNLISFMSLAALTVRTQSCVFTRRNALIRANQYNFNELFYEARIAWTCLYNIPTISSNAHNTGACNVATHTTELFSFLSGFGSASVCFGSHCFPPLNRSARQDRAALRQSGRSLGAFCIAEHKQWRQMGIFDDTLSEYGMLGR